MLSKLSLTLARWLIVLALIFGPWAYGATRPDGILVLTIICGCASFFWLFGRLAERSLPRVPGALVLFVIAVLAQGWWMTWNGLSIYDRFYGQFAYLEAPFPDAPGSVDKSLSTDFMIPITALLFTCMAVADLGRKRSFRQIILATMVITGTSLSLLGFWILLGKSKILCWPYGTSPFMFATFRYHGNAGSFLNLVFPPAIALALLSCFRSQSKWLRSFTFFSMLTLFLAVAVNSSRGAQGVAAIMFVIMGILLVQWRQILLPGMPFRVIGASLVFLFCLFLASATVIGTKRTQGRWHGFWAQEGGTRVDAYQTQLHMPADAGLLGSGPATFQARFPFYNAVSETKVPLFWNVAHQDYMQTVVEWGYVGTTFWTLLVGIGCIRLFFSMRHQMRDEKLGDSLFALAIMVSLGGLLLHSMMDFPLQIVSLELYVLVFLGLAWCSPDWTDGRRKVKIGPEKS